MDEKDIKFDWYRPSGFGVSFHIPVDYCAVRLTHIPTGLDAVCDKHKSIISNKLEALEELDQKVKELETDNRSYPDCRE